MDSVQDVMQSVRDADAVVIITNHKVYDYQAIVENSARLRQPQRDRVLAQRPITLCDYKAVADRFCYSDHTTGAVIHGKLSGYRRSRVHRRAH